MDRRKSSLRVRAPGLATVACVLAALLLAVAANAVLRGAESVNSGGAAATSASFRAHDSIGQHAIGPMGQGTTLRMYDGFWLVLPGINVPVEGAVFAVLTETGAPLVRWTAGSLADVTGFNVYRSTEETGDYERLNEEPLPAQTPGSYVDPTAWPETTFWYEVRAILGDGSEDVLTGQPASVTTAGTLAFALHAPRPNPCSGATSFQFDLPAHKGDVSLVLYNVHGRKVREILAGPVERGRRVQSWDGLDEGGLPVAAGVYFARLVVDGRAADQKVLVIR